MALQVKVSKRKFILTKKKGEDVELKDPHPDMSVQEVINHYSNQHPELATATVTGPKMEADKAVYKFATVLGDKG